MRRTAIGMIFQSGNLVPELTLIDNVRVAHSDVTTERAQAQLAKFGLASVAGTAAKAVSGGQAQRAAIARALLHTPAIILADEPTSGLDNDNGDGVRALLRDAANAGAAVMIASHEDDTRSIADTTLHLEDGRLV